MKNFNHVLDCFVRKSRSVLAMTLRVILFFIFLSFISINYAQEKGQVKEAMFYKKLEENKQVQCLLCPRKCIIPDKARGVCRVRENRNGILYPITYGKPCSITLNEPIEKAPFYHFKPGHIRLALSTVGCNLQCKFCQNWATSQRTLEEVNYYELSPEQIVQMALKEKVGSICFTYTEPTVFFEYMYDIAKIARQKGLKTSMVSAGFINPEPLKELLKVLDAVKIDLKAFNEDFYNEITLGGLEPVLKTIKIVKESGKHLEIVNLVIPTLNDKPEEIKKMCEWIKKEIGTDVPLHFTRFGPAYKFMHLPPTPIETLEKAYRIAKEVGLKYVYLGNVPGHKYNNTYCPKCGKLLINRVHFQVIENKVKNGKCPFCKTKINGLWK